MSTPELEDSVLWHALKSIAGGQAKKGRDLLKAGKQYPFFLAVTGQVGGVPVQYVVKGSLRAEGDSHQNKGPAAAEIVARLLSLVGPRVRSRICRELPATSAAVPESCSDAAASVIKRLSSRRPKRGEVKVDFEFTELDD